MKQKMKPKFEGRCRSARYYRLVRIQLILSILCFLFSLVCNSSSIRFRKKPLSCAFQDQYPCLNKKKVIFTTSDLFLHNHEGFFIFRSYDVILNRSSGIDHIYIFAFHINLYKLVLTYISTYLVHGYILISKGTRKSKTYSQRHLFCFINSSSGGLL